MTIQPAARAGALALALGLAACGGDDGAAGDTTGEDLATLEADGFSMDFPEGYETQEESAMGLEFTMYTAELDGDEGFAAFLVDPPEGQPISLEGALEGGAANVNGTVEDSGAITLDGVDGLQGRFSAEQDGESGTAWIVVADVDGSLFQFMYVTAGREDATDPPAIFDDLVESIAFDQGS